MREKALSAPLVTLAGRRRRRAVVCGTVLDLKAVALHTILGAGEARRVTRYTKRKFKFLKTLSFNLN